MIQNKNRHAYKIWVPSRICRVFLGLNDYIGHQHHGKHQGTDQHPASLPEDIGLGPRHELNVLTKAVGQVKKKVKNREEKLHKETLGKEKKNYFFMP